nr:unnamed protein product [Digitaria exilis]
MPAALKMPEPELIEHAGLDSAVYVRIYLLGLKIFVPIALLAFAVLVPVNWTSGTLENEKGINYDQIDKLSISNLGKGSKRLALSPDQDLKSKLVLVRNVPPDPDESVSEHVEHFFAVNHRDHYLSHQTGLWGLWGQRVDAIEYYKKEIEELCKQEDEERQKVITDPNSIMPAAFVSFKTRWGAAVCAQTQQTTIVQSLANLDDIEKVLPFLKPIIERIPEVVGESIPMKAAFFMTYIMVDGWAVVTPMLLPFIIVFFSLAYVVFRHQIINVYTQQYESGAQFWPDVHMRLIIALIVSQILLLGLLSTQEAEKSTVALLPLPVLSIWFHYVCKGRFEPAFVKFPLQVRLKISSQI